eukprot:4290197-Amphidinium_carterae.1
MPSARNVSASQLPLSWNFSASRFREHLNQHSNRYQLLASALQWLAHGLDNHELCTGRVGHDHAVRNCDCVAVKCTLSCLTCVCYDS